MSTYCTYSGSCRQIEGERNTAEWLKCLMHNTRASRHCAAARLLSSLFCLSVMSSSSRPSSPRAATASNILGGETSSGGSVASVVRPSIGVQLIGHNAVTHRPPVSSHVTGMLPAHSLPPSLQSCIVNRLLRRLEFLLLRFAAASDQRARGLLQTRRLHDFIHLEEKFLIS